MDRETESLKFLKPFSVQFVFLLWLFCLLKLSYVLFPVKNFLHIHKSCYIIYCHVLLKMLQFKGGNRYIGPTILSIVSEICH